MRRSMLFLPGNTPNIIVNGEILGADAVILDLEDAVAPAEKDSARILVRNAIKYMGFGKSEVIVRINAIDTAFWQKDLDAIIPVHPSLIMPPKTACAEDVLAVDAYITQLEEELGLEQGSVGLIPLIETALGVENAYQIASACPRVKAIFLGGEDLTADLRCKRTKEGQEIFYAAAAWWWLPALPVWRSTIPPLPMSTTTREFIPMPSWPRAWASPVRHPFLPAM